MIIGADVIGSENCAVEKLVSGATEEEKLLLRFCNRINKQVIREDDNNYIRQEVFQYA